MRLCYIVTILFAIGGAVFNDFSQASMLAFLFIAVSALPLLICALDTPALVSGTYVQSSRLAALRLVFLGLAIINVVVFVLGQGFRIADLFSPEGILQIAQQATADRYELGSTSGNPLLVCAVFVNAFLWAGARMPFLFALLIGLIPAAVYSILSTEKWPLYCAMSFFLTNMLLLRAIEGRRLGLASFGPAALLTVPAALLSLVMRQGISEGGAAVDASGELTYMLAHYMFGGYEAFGQWLGAHYDSCCTLGFYTFVGPASVLGLGERQQGVFEENIVVQGLETNIYTAWRYLAEDFSIIGPILLVSAYALGYRYCVLSHKPRAAMALFTILVVATLLQINTTVFVHNSVALAALACAIASGTLFYKPHESTRADHM